MNDMYILSIHFFDQSLKIVHKMSKEIKKKQTKIDPSVLIAKNLKWYPRKIFTT